MRTGELLPTALARAPLLASDGSAVPIDTLIGGGRRLLLIFMRHFGCIGCAEQVVAILPRLELLAELGVRVVLVGSGPHEHLEAFRTRHDLEDKQVEVFTDPTLVAFAAAGLLRSFWATWGPRAGADFVRAFVHGHRPGRTDGDLNQQGGALLVDDDGKVVWAHRNETLGGHANPAEMMDAVLRLALERSPLFV